MLAKFTANALSAIQKRLLIAHIDTTRYHNYRPLDVRDGHQATRFALVARGLIRFTAPAHPKGSYITEYGREVLAFILAARADELVEAGNDGILKTPAAGSAPARVLEPA